MKAREEASRTNPFKFPYHNGIIPQLAHEKMVLSPAPFHTCKFKLCAHLDSKETSKLSHM